MGIANLDANFPRFTEETTEEKVAQIQDYLYMLLENLRYTLSNLDEGNWNPASLSNITEPVKARIKDLEGNITELQITAQGLSTRVTNAEGSISTLTQTATGLTTRISDAEGNISSLTQTATSLSSRISGVRGDVNEVIQTLDGVVFYDSQSGVTVIDGSHITTGTIEASRIGAGTMKLGNSTTRGILQLYERGGATMWIESNAYTNALGIMSALGNIILSCSYSLKLEAERINVSNYGDSLPGTGLEEEGDLFFLLS